MWFKKKQLVPEWMVQQWKEDYRETLRTLLDGEARHIESKDEVILILRTELQAAREHIGLLQRWLSEERDRSNLAADELIVAAGRHAISASSARRERETHLMNRGATVRKKVDESDPFDPLPYGHNDGTFASAADAEFDDVGEVARGAE